MYHCTERKYVPSPFSTIALPALSASHSHSFCCRAILPSCPFRPQGPALTACCAASAPCSVRQSPVLRNLSLAMASSLFTPKQKEIIRENPITKVIDANRDSLPKDLSSFDQDIDNGT